MLVGNAAALSLSSAISRLDLTLRLAHDRNRRDGYQLNRRHGGGS